MMRDKGNLLFILSILNTATSPASNSTNLPGAIVGGAQEGLAATKKLQDDEFMKGAIQAGKLVGREVEAGRVPTPAEAAAAAVRGA